MDFLLDTEFNTADGVALTSSEFNLPIYRSLGIHYDSEVVVHHPENHKDLLGPLDLLSMSPMINLKPSISIFPSLGSSGEVDCLGWRYAPWMGGEIGGTSEKTKSTPPSVDPNFPLSSTTVKTTLDLEDCETLVQLIDEWTAAQENLSVSYVPDQFLWNCTHCKGLESIRFDIRLFHGPSLDRSIRLIVEAQRLRGNATLFHQTFRSLCLFLSPEQDHSDEACFNSLPTSPGLLEPSLESMNPVPTLMSSMPDHSFLAKANVAFASCTNWVAPIEITSMLDAIQNLQKWLTDDPMEALQFVGVMSTYFSPFDDLQQQKQQQQQQDQQLQQQACDDATVPSTEDAVVPLVGSAVAAQTALLPTAAADSAAELTVKQAIQTLCLQICDILVTLSNKLNGCAKYTMQTAAAFEFSEDCYAELNQFGATALRSIVFIRDMLVNHAVLPVGIPTRSAGVECKAEPGGAPAGLGSKLPSLGKDGSMIHGDSYVMELLCVLLSSFHALLVAYPVDNAAGAATSTAAASVFPSTMTGDDSTAKLLANPATSTKSTTNIDASTMQQLCGEFDMFRNIIFAHTDAIAALVLSKLSRATAPAVAAPAEPHRSNGELKTFANNAGAINAIGVDVCSDYGFYGSNY